MIDLEAQQERGEGGSQERSRPEGARAIKPHTRLGGLRNLYQLLEALFITDIPAGSPS